MADSSIPIYRVGQSQKFKDMADNTFAPVVYVPDYWVEYAEDEVLSIYGVQVSAIDKKKSLNKFGRTLNADAGVTTTVAAFQGAVVNETFATTNSVDSMVGDSADDAGRVIKFEGHYFDGSNNLVFGTEEITHAGLTPVALSRGYCRANRMSNKKGTFASPATALVGNTYIYDATLATGTTSGTPDVATATKCMIVAGKQQSAKCATSVSGTDYFFLKYAYVSVSRAGPQNAVIDVDVEYRELGGVWLPLGLEITLDEATKGSEGVEISPFFIIPKNSDLRMVVTSDTADTKITARLHGIFASVVA